MDKQHKKVDFCLAIDFDKDSTNPARVFKALSGIIESFEKVDKTLIKAFDIKIEPVLMLEEVEKGSIKVWLAQMLNSIDDDGLKDLEWKKVIGNYLVQAKYILVDFCSKNTEITNKEQILNLEKNIFEEAKKTNINNLDCYNPIDTKSLMGNLKEINNSLQYLNPKDKVIFDSKDKKTEFNLEFNFSPETVEELLTETKLESTNKMLLKIKKPDFLGESMWEFRHGRETIFAKILDEDWLKKFQTRQIDIRPQDSIEADVQIITKYDYDNELIGVNRNILKVHKTVPHCGSQQQKLFEKE